MAVLECPSGSTSGFTSSTRSIIYRAILDRVPRRHHCRIHHEGTKDTKATKKTTNELSFSVAVLRGPSCPSCLRGKEPHNLEPAAEPSHPDGHAVASRCQNDNAPPRPAGWGVGAGQPAASAQLGKLHVRSLPLHVPDQPGRGVAERAPRYHIVDLPVLQQELRRLEPLGQVLPDRLLDHPLSR